MKSTDISTALPAPPALPLDWSGLREVWPSWTWQQRRQLARELGRRLHTLWAGRDDLDRLPPARWRFSLTPDGTPLVHPPEHLRHSLPLRLTAHQVCRVLAVWLSAGTGMASRRDQAAFATAFFQHEMMDRQAYRHAWAEIARQARLEAAALARTLYAHHIRPSRREGGLVGWTRDPHVRLADLHQMIQAAEQDPATTWIKRRPPTRLFLTQLAGQTVVVKRHDARTAWERLRYRFRASRARRSYAAGLTVRDLGLPTPTPLAWLEVSRSCSYIVQEWLPNVVSVRAWVRQQGRTWSGETWTRWRRELLEFFVTPYTRGFYHDDTKALNILLDPDGPPGQRLWWIDVEGVIPGARLTRYRVLRNLAQLNGSLRTWVPDDQRLAFLHGVGWYFPWLHHPRVAAHLRAWTHRRLLREVHRVCGP